MKKYLLILLMMTVPALSVQALEEAQSNRLMGQILFKGSECSKKQNLMGQNYVNQNLVRVNLSGCQLQHSDFSKAVLTASRFRSSNLIQTDFSHADLSGADLRGANLQEAILYNTMLPGISFNSTTNFTNAHYNENTKFPRNFVPQAHGMIFDSIHSIR